MAGADVTVFKCFLIYSWSKSTGKTKVAVFMMRKKNPWVFANHRSHGNSLSQDLTLLTFEGCFHEQGWSVSLISKPARRRLEYRRGLSHKFLPTPIFRMKLCYQHTWLVIISWNSWTLECFLKSIFICEAYTEGFFFLHLLRLQCRCKTFNG